MRVRKALLVLTIVALTVLTTVGAAIRLLRPNPVTPAWVDEYDVTASAPETIAPGTVIESAAPKGWSHLVIKSLPRVRPSEVERVPDNLMPKFGRAGVVRMVGWMFTAFVADVVQERQGEYARYRLRAIGLGLGTKANGHDTIVTSQTARHYGVEIGVLKIEEQVLDTGYRIQKQAIIPVHGPSFALLDTPVTVRCGTKHQTIRYRYALLVDTKTGTLDVLLWQLLGDRGECGDLTRLVWLEPSCIDEAELVPDREEFNRFGVPSEIAFAVDKLPPYRLEMAVPPELRELVGRTKFTPDEARALEAGLRKLTAGARP
ncbi:Uncharacterized protein OS=Singulisphaera acidiphila (strain ATCC BAA-1392 / DSM 18658 / VKM B-2454 / MOB10) GN=Sinac_4667 PE=4 SV=1 [Gemmata massiliana]|uniref:Uncharacterized protein n=1 Tax=Gemmata massiliana TaxID=1210884 RepID=A0A6P2CX60_9BACT|nr:hypothetical protein [Gemmata massiliana]VTR92976.1 Uncharacterized protein OS=Singulisphaera acidiphila (strain ATCC BAA-1392 / DSM 18658 / VKM B-2454 / MOB10) GN=Sinac_4667 PE=4 SV=1 [Gemmata massiliana]